MRTAFAMLIGAGVLSFAVVDCANAAVRHRHAQPRQQAVTASAPQPGSSDYSTKGNNPAKQYPSRNASANAARNGTLMQNGNNPAKRYPSRQSAENAARSGTLMQNGNNPAKRYKGTTGSAQ